MIVVILVIVGVLLFFQLKRDKKYKEEKLLQEEINRQYQLLQNEVLDKLGINSWTPFLEIDDRVYVKSRQSMDNYDTIKYFKENDQKLNKAISVCKYKKDVFNKVRAFLDENEYKNKPEYENFYEKLESLVRGLLNNNSGYIVRVIYKTQSGKEAAFKNIFISEKKVNNIKNDPSILMSKSEYNKYIKEQQAEELASKQHKYYDKVNNIVDLVNKNKASLIIKDSKEHLDDLIARLFDRTVNSIKKIKNCDSEEWGIIDNFISSIQEDVENILNKNNKIYEYYESEEFNKIKSTCQSMMSSQIEFNEYIDEKVESITKLFGTRVTRTETENEDLYEYIRPYKKTVTPFTAEVSSTVFASAENNPLEYVVKNFYPSKASYPEQIQKLQLLIEELETLREAKVIIDNYKKEYQQYIIDVPAYILEYDEAGFYSRLGFANINEETLTVEYKFSYTSDGGMAKRSFTVPMTEDTIVELINLLESKLSASAFSKEQRALMTKKLREQIKVRDNYTCCTCGNSTHVEPNLLLEIDHIIPVAKGGFTKEDNLQTLCWKCNRSKSDKIL